MQLRHVLSRYTVCRFFESSFVMKIFKGSPQLSEGRKFGNGTIFFSLLTFLFLFFSFSRANCFSAVLDICLHSSLPLVFLVYLIHVLVFSLFLYNFTILRSWHLSPFPTHILTHLRDGYEVNERRTNETSYKGDNG